MLQGHDLYQFKLERSRVAKKPDTAQLLDYHLYRSYTLKHANAIADATATLPGKP
jgi:hypothetical protein